jgi:hypothetical protein
MVEKGKEDEVKADDEGIEEVRKIFFLFNNCGKKND